MCSCACVWQSGAAEARCEPADKVVTYRFSKWHHEEKARDQVFIEDETLYVVSTPMHDLPTTDALRNIALGVYASNPKVFGYKHLCAHGVFFDELPEMSVERTFLMGFMDGHGGRADGLGYR